MLYMTKERRRIFIWNNYVQKWDIGYQNYYLIRRANGY